MGPRPDGHGIMRSPGDCNASAMPESKNRASSRRSRVRVDGFGFGRGYARTASLPRFFALSWRDPSAGPQPQPLPVRANCSAPRTVRVPVPSQAKAPPSSPTPAKLCPRTRTLTTQQKRMSTAQKRAALARHRRCHARNAIAALIAAADKRNDYKARVQAVSLFHHQVPERIDDDDERTKTLMLTIRDGDGCTGGF